MQVNYEDIRCPICGIPPRLTITHESIPVCLIKEMFHYSFKDGEGYYTIFCFKCGHRVDAAFNKNWRNESVYSPSQKRALELCAKEFLRCKNLSPSYMKKLAKCITAKTIGSLENA